MKRMLLQERLRIACKQPERMSKVGGSRLDPTQNEDLDLVGDIEFRSGGTANGKRSRGEVPETPILEGGSRLGKVPRLEAARAVPKESTVSKRRLSVGDSDGESPSPKKARKSKPRSSRVVQSDPESESDSESESTAHSVPGPPVGPDVEPPTAPLSSTLAGEAASVNSSVKTVIEDDLPPNVATLQAVLFIFAMLCSPDDWQMMLVVAFRNKMVFMNDLRNGARIVADLASSGVGSDDCTQLEADAAWALLLSHFSDNVSVYSKYLDACSTSSSPSMMVGREDSRRVLVDALRSLDSKLPPAWDALLKIAPGSMSAPVSAGAFPDRASGLLEFMEALAAAGLAGKCGDKTLGKTFARDLARSTQTTRSADHIELFGVSPSNGPGWSLQPSSTALKIARKKSAASAKKAVTKASEKKAKAAAVIACASTAPLIVFVSPVVGPQGGPATPLSEMFKCVFDAIGCLTGPDLAILAAFLVSMDAHTHLFDPGVYAIGAECQYLPTSCREVCQQVDSLFKQFFDSFACVVGAAASVLRGKEVSVVYGADLLETGFPTKQPRQPPQDEEPNERQEGATPLDELEDEMKKGLPSKEFSRLDCTNLPRASERSTDISIHQLTGVNHTTLMICEEGTPAPQPKPASIAEGGLARVQVHAPASIQLNDAFHTAQDAGKFLHSQLRHIYFTGRVRVFAHTRLCSTVLFGSLRMVIGHLFPGMLQYTVVAMPPDKEMGGMHEIEWSSWEVSIDADWTPLASASERFLHWITSATGEELKELKKGISFLARLFKHFEGVNHRLSAAAASSEDDVSARTELYYAESEGMAPSDRRVYMNDWIADSSAGITQIDTPDFWVAVNTEGLLRSTGTSVGNADTCAASLQESLNAETSLALDNEVHGLYWGKGDASAFLCFAEAINRVCNSDSGETGVTHSPVTKTCKPFSHGKTGGVRFTAFDPMSAQPKKGPGSAGSTCGALLIQMYGVFLGRILVPKALAGLELPNGVAAQLTIYDKLYNTSAKVDRAVNRVFLTLECLAQLEGFPLDYSILSLSGILTQVNAMQSSTTHAVRGQRQTRPVELSLKGSTGAKGTLQEGTVHSRPVLTARVVAPKLADHVFQAFGNKACKFGARYVGECFGDNTAIVISNSITELQLKSPKFNFHLYLMAVVYAVYKRCHSRRGNRAPMLPLPQKISATVFADVVKVMSTFALEPNDTRSAITQTHIDRLKAALRVGGDMFATGSAEPGKFVMPPLVKRFLGQLGTLIIEYAAQCVGVDTQFAFRFQRLFRMYGLLFVMSNVHRTCVQTTAGTEPQAAFETMSVYRRAVTDSQMWMATAASHVPYQVLAAFTAHTVRTESAAIAETTTRRTQAIMLTLTWASVKGDQVNAALGVVTDVARKVAVAGAAEQDEIASELPECGSVPAIERIIGLDSGSSDQKLTKLMESITSIIAVRGVPMPHMKEVMKVVLSSLEATHFKDESFALVHTAVAATIDLVIAAPTLSAALAEFLPVAWTLAMLSSNATVRAHMSNVPTLINKTKLALLHKELQTFQPMAFALKVDGSKEGTTGASPVVASKTLADGFKKVEYTDVGRVIQAKDTMLNGRQTTRETLYDLLRCAITVEYAMVLALALSHACGHDSDPQNAAETVTALLTKIFTPGFGLPYAGENGTKGTPLVEKERDHLLPQVFDPEEKKNMSNDISTFLGRMHSEQDVKDGAGQVFSQTVLLMSAQLLSVSVKK